MILLFQVCPFFVILNVKIQFFKDVTYTELIMLLMIMVVTNADFCYYQTLISFLKVAQLFIFTGADLELDWENVSEIISFFLLLSFN